jgi:hypothetical protein
MSPIVTSVKPEKDYFLTLKFSNGEMRRFDVKPYLDKGIFQELKDVSKFFSIHTDGLSVEWENEAALCPDTLYFGSILID